MGASRAIMLAWVLRSSKVRTLGTWTTFVFNSTVGPIARFGDTAANAGILALMKGNPTMKNLPIFVQTVFASLCAAGFRMILTPIDTIKTTMQTQGKQGWPLLKNRMCVGDAAARRPR